MVISCERYPILETINILSFGDRVNVNCPFASVVVPRFVPLIRMFTPGKGLFSSALVTLPVTVDDWAKVFQVRTSPKKLKMTAFKREWVIVFLKTRGLFF